MIVALVMKKSTKYSYRFRGISYVPDTVLKYCLYYFILSSQKFHQANNNPRTLCVLFWNLWFRQMENFLNFF